MKHIATDSQQRPSLGMLGAEPFRAAMAFALHKFGTSANMVISSRITPNRPHLPAGAWADSMCAKSAS